MDTDTNAENSKKKREIEGTKKVDENSFNKFTTNNFINLFNLNPSI